MRALTEVPFLRAMAPSVSPFFTVLVRALGADLREELFLAAVLREDLLPAVLFRADDFLVTEGLAGGL